MVWHVQDGLVRQRFARARRSLSAALGVLGVIAASVFFLRWGSFSTSDGLVRPDDVGGQLVESEFDIDDSVRLPTRG
jgi:hypothetical protein